MYPSPHHAFATSNYFLGSPKRKGGQVRFTAHQTQVLEKRFISHKYLSPEERRNLAMQLQLSDRQVKTWFQNRRAKYRRSSCPDDIIRKDSRVVFDQHLNRFPSTSVVNPNNNPTNLTTASNMISQNQDYPSDSSSSSSELELDLQQME